MLLCRSKSISIYVAMWFCLALQLFLAGFHPNPKPTNRRALPQILACCPQAVNRSHTAQNIYNPANSLTHRRFSRLFLTSLRNAHESSTVTSIAFVWQAFKPYTTPKSWQSKCISIYSTKQQQGVTYDIRNSNSSKLLRILHVLIRFNHALLDNGYRIQALLITN